MSFRRLLALPILLSLSIALLAQETAREERQIPGAETPMWTNPKGFEKDVFTFVRIRYSTGNRTFHPSDYFGGFGRGRGRGSRGSWRWRTDYPDADLNFSFRLQQMTSLKVDPYCRVLEITDPELFRFPFIYIVEPGDLTFTSEEVPILRRYLLNGGFLMLDDFWGEDEWDNMAEAIAMVFPDRKWVDLPRTHPIFHCVFDIPNDLNLQVPNVALGTASQYHGITWEREDAREVHVRAIYDDKGRMMVLATHNTDNGDGWEREGENEYYFREFSEKKTYPLTINIVFYVMTH
jgi:hypothetical protein